MDTSLGSVIGSAKFDLHLELDRRPEGHMEGRLMYNTDILSERTAVRIRECWTTLLSEVAAEPSRSISELCLVPGEERQRQLFEWNQTGIEIPYRARVHDLVARQAALTPGATAVRDGKSCLSYADLDSLSSKLAGHLSLQGAEPGNLIGVCLERSADMLIALLAVLKAGCAFVPLEPDQPRARSALIIADAKPSHVLTTAHLAADILGESTQVVLVDADRTAWMAAEPFTEGAVDATGLAYVMYTSGSTGRPKGVMIEHRALVNQILWCVSAFHLGPSDRVLQKTPFGFDVSLWELFCPLVSGGTVVMLTPGAHGDPVQIARAIREEGITAVHFVPSMLKTYLDTVGSGGFEGVRLVAASGEALSAHLVQCLFECVGPEVQVCNLYGPTEACVHATYWWCTAGDTVVPIGRPVANTQVYVLDTNLNPVPVGAAGELFIGGAGVGRGYLNLPELNRERFLADPFHPPGRIYRTGDIARYRSDSSVEFLGRVDQQVKIRGTRVELGEVEAAVVSHPSVQQAVVLARPGEDSELGLTAYMVIQPTEVTPSHSNLRSHLAERLPKAMIPSMFVTVDAIPVTGSGKVDRSAFPPPGSVARGRDTSVVPPSNNLERSLILIWESVLGVHPIDVDSDFFELGGHSLLAVRLLSEVERSIGLRVPLSSTLANPFTVRRMASVLSEPPQDGGAVSKALASSSADGRPILFFIYPDRASMVTLRHFKGPLALELNVVGITPERGGGPAESSSTVEVIGAGLIATMRAMQPFGPYQLAGFSFGGLLAYEVAKQLVDAGQTVQWLGILDSGTPALSHRALWIHSRRRFVARLVESGPRRLASWLLYLTVYAVKVPLSRLGLVPVPVRDDFDWRGALKLASTHAFQGLEVPLDLFVSVGSAEKTDSASLGWVNVHRGPIALHAIPGEHLDVITEPHVRLVVEIVRTSLRRTMSSGAALAG
jgi:amino acid adenylation domain-containing protein